ncbi:TRAP transporter substrate-binding protein [Pseudooctadecabacter jejudonensis]|uniref:Sialic acid-binding periplasmic protein SiaP n=1 Tax=Pseudooctadecabacter jejudonensis TaxID=1391910 RepID=A0A1Y5RMB2_9RHOB|nr:TRAP transporter substrate-binding protein [Pseudooctadecabacter jejudonensis]SLN18272.1 Sialic acid-binding periplasmic protein SiaP precursor [Pseudooctadecabacter jejudonensis]
MFKPILAGALSTLALTSAAHAQEFTFSIHHFLSPQSLTHTDMIEPWAAAIEEASDGRIAFEIFPAMSLGGAPPELYSQVRDGVADVIWTVPGYTPGTFPRTEVFELPSVHQGDARATNLAIQDVMDTLAPDFEDIHPLLVHVHTGNAVHLNGADITSVDDFAGLKLRSPSRTGAWMVEALGAEPVGMPVPALPQALSRGTVDAGLVPFEIAIPLGLADLTTASVELHDGARFGTATFLFAMNQNSYDSLPADLQKIVDDASDEAFAIAMGEAWNAIEPVGIQRAIDAGNSVTQLSTEATAAFAAPFAEVEARWTAEATEAGIDAEALLAEARAAIAANAGE